MYHPTGKLSRGFTLIELIAVMVIIGALGSVATSRFAFLAEQADQAVIDSTYYEKWTPKIGQPSKPLLI